MIGNIVVISILAVVVFFAIRKVVKDRKSSSCGCGCSSCGRGCGGCGQQASGEARRED